VQGGEDHVGAAFGEVREQAGIRVAQLDVMAGLDEGVGDTAAGAQ
jgi:hypothetical protein